MGAATEQRTRRIHCSRCTFTPPLVATPLRCHPPSEGQANGVGTKDSGRGVNRSSPETTTFPLMLMEPPFREHPGSTSHHPTPYKGEEALKRDGERGGNTTWHKVWWHHQQKNRRRSRGAEWRTPIDSRQKSTTSISLSREPAPW